MANTYTQLFIQLVFAVRGRKNLINESFRIEFEKLICGIVQKHDCKVYAIYCNPDHTHVLLSLDPKLSLSKIVEIIKANSSKWLNEKRYTPMKFEWQKGYGAFTYSKSQIDQVVKYIFNQPEHHKKQNFKEEYILLLKKFDIDFDTRYLFDADN